MTDHAYEIGQQVSVPRGLDVVQGTVDGVYGDERNRQVILHVETEGGDSETITVPASVLDAARRDEAEHQPGAWLSAYQYEQALEVALADIFRSIDSKFSQTSPGPRDSGFDIAFFTPERMVVFEAKHRSRETLDAGGKYLDQLAACVHEIQARVTRSISGILVTNAKIPHGLAKRAAIARDRGESLWIARWAPDEGLDELADIVRKAVSFQR
ncbi:hypothetical protein [Streptomyces virginiae]|uniref:hypothetical protein n=1 Tax=Streptomyces virginiae TaxID=1961 RepID=UPI003246286E